MIQFTNPKLNVEQIVESIRLNLARRNEQSKLLNMSGYDSVAIEKLDISIQQIQGLLNNAETRAYSRTKLPDRINRFPFNASKKLEKIVLKIFNFVFRDQREVNINLISSIQESLAINQQLIAEVGRLRSRIQFLENGKNENFKKIDESITSLERSLNIVDEQIATIDESLISIDKNTTNLELSLTKATDNIERLETKTEEINASVNNYWMSLPTDLQIYHNAEEKQELENLYVALEDSFRGDRQEIANRLQVYLPLISENKLGTPEYPVLDLGCGRGEWLELLKGSNFIAKGVDTNSLNIERCLSLQLEVIEAEAIQYLQSLPDASISAVTGFHIIEHLPFQVLINLLDETVRVLKSGGLAIFETPDPENVLVGSHTFYLDPTHKKPLPSLLTQFLARSRGLSQVEIWKLNPHPTRLKDSDSEIATLFNEYFYGARDYAIVGYKA